MIMHHYQNIKSINAKILCSINSRKMSKIVCLKIIIQIHHMYYFQKEPFLINQKDFDVDYYQLKNYYQILRKFSGNCKGNIIIKNWNFYKFYNFYKYFICVFFFILTIYEFQIQMFSSKVHHLVHKEEDLVQEHLYHLQLYNEKKNII